MIQHALLFTQKYLHFHSPQPHFSALCHLLCGSMGYTAKSSTSWKWESRPWCHCCVFCESYLSLLWQSQIFCHNFLHLLWSSSFSFYRLLKPDISKDRHLYKCSSNYSLDARILLFKDQHRINVFPVKVVFFQSLSTKISRTSTLSSIMLHYMLLTFRYCLWCANSQEAVEFPSVLIGSFLQLHILKSRLIMFL